MNKAPPAIVAKARAAALRAPRRVVAVIVPMSYRTISAIRNAIAPTATKLEISSNARFISSEE